MPPRPGSTKRAPKDDAYDDEEDEYYEAPPRRRSARDEDEPAPRNRARARDDDDEDEEPAPRRRTRARDEEDDDEPAPRRRSRARDDDEDEDDEPAPRRRPRARDDDDEDRPARRTRARDDEDDEDGAEDYATGWDGARKTQQAAGAFADDLKFDKDEAILIKFLSDEPVVSYQQHWVERKGKKSFTCAGKANKCPLCATGDDARPQYVFAVAEIDAKGKGAMKLFKVSGKVKDQIKKLHEDPRNGPLSKNYWSVSKSGKGTSSVTNFQGVKERDLEDEWNILPLKTSALRALEEAIPKPSSIAKPNLKQLKEIQAEIMGDDMDDDD